MSNADLQKQRPRVSIIVARALHNVIGFNNTLPWHLPEDLAHFKRTTLGKTVIMGRKTFESIVARLGRPLPGRRNIVVTRNSSWTFPGIDHASSLDQALLLCAAEPRVFVIGGAQLYAEALHVADELIITEIDRMIEGDAFFPEINMNDWHQTKCEDHREHTLPFSFVTYQRVEMSRA